MKLANNIEIPDIGLGVYKISEVEMNEIILKAYNYGYRLFDTAQMYKNEEYLGNAITNNGIDRDEIFIISKVDNCNQGYGNTINSFEESLKKLRTTYLDSFLIHWPGQNFERMLDTWKAMEYLYEEGRVKSIGVCNFEKSQLKVLIENCKIVPMINQIEHSPIIHNEDLITFCNSNDIKIMAWGPLLRGRLENESISVMASKYGKTPAQLLLRWNIQQGIIPIPKTKNEKRLMENISVFDFNISSEDIKILNGMNENRRSSHDPLTFDF